MSDKVELEKAKHPTLEDVFEGIKGRRPKSPDELKQWLATDEGNEATIFESASVSRAGAKLAVHKEKRVAARLIFNDLVNVRYWPIADMP